LAEPRPKPIRKKKPLWKRAWRSFQKDFGPVAAPPLGVGLLRTFSLTMKKEVYGLAPLIESIRNGEPVMLAFWHGRLLMLPVFYERYLPWEVHVMISYHADGEIIARMAENFGLHTVRGSSKKDAKKASKRMIRLMRSGTPVAITPDGPRGPGMVAKRGVVELARIGRAKVFPVSYAASRQIRLSTWDRFVIPMPFSKLVFVVGDPIKVNGNEARKRREELLREIQRRMIETDRNADRLAGNER